jgi:LPS O-antigen subunit length determinant protein (WzzB/FepE family)
MAQEIRTIALSGLDNEFVFKIVDKPRVPNKRARPSRALNIITWFIFSIVTSCMCVLGLHRLNIHRKWM